MIATILRFIRRVLGTQQVMDSLLSLRHFLEDRENIGATALTKEVPNAEVAPEIRTAL